MKKEYDFSKGRRGAVSAKKNKTRITMYLDTEVLTSCRSRAESLGIGYQTFINQVLREHLAGSGPLDAKTLRRIVREELRTLRSD